MLRKGEFYNLVQPSLDQIRENASFVSCKLLRISQVAKARNMTIGIAVQPHLNCVSSFLRGFRADLGPFNGFQWDKFAGIARFKALLLFRF